MRYTQNEPAPTPAPGCQLPVDRIIPRPRLHFVHDAGSLQALAESIRFNGLQRPLLVRRVGNGRYAIVSGNRRLMACRMLGLSHVSAYVLADDARRQSANQLIDALITHRLHYLEEAAAMRALNEQHGMSRGDMANLLGLSGQAVTEQLRLTALDDELCAFLMDEGVPLCIALTLLRLPDDRARMSAACRIARERLCVRDAALLVSAMRTRPNAINGGDNREKKIDAHQNSQNHTRNVIGVVRDQRLYLNAIRDIAGQMRAAGVDAVVTEEKSGGRLAVTVSIPVRRRRAARYQSM